MKCDCGFKTTKKSEFIAHVQWHQDSEQLQEEYEEFPKHEPNRTSISNIIRMGKILNLICLIFDHNYNHLLGVEDTKPNQNNTYGLVSILLCRQHKILFSFTFLSLVPSLQFCHLSDLEVLNRKWHPLDRYHPHHRNNILNL